MQLFSGISAFADYYDYDYDYGNYKARLCDYDDSLTDEEESELLIKMQETADKIGCNVGVVITSDLNGKSDVRYADDFLDESFGYGSSSIVLLLANNQSNPNYTDWISTSGRARDYYDNRTDSIFDAVYKGLDTSGFAKAVENYCSYLEKHDSAGISVSLDFDSLLFLAACAVVGIVVTAIVVSGTMRGYSRKNPISALRYIDQSRTIFRHSDDVFIREYNTSYRVSSDSHGGGHGGHGGGGGSHRSGGGHGGGGGRHR